MEETMRKLTEMSLHAMVDTIKELQRSAQLSKLSITEVLCFMVDAEYNKRRSNRIKRLKKAADIRISSAAVQEIQYGSERNLFRDKVTDLVTGRYIEHCNNILISGATGVGKTYFASALGNMACTMGITVKYYRISKLLEAMEIEKEGGNYLKFLEKISKVKVLILDDLGPDVMNKRQRSFFFDLIEERDRNCSTIVASQLPIKQWYHLFEDESIADAICDRLYHNAFRIELEGESMRKKSATLGTQL